MDFDFEAFKKRMKKREIRAEKGASKKCIKTRLELQLACLVLILRSFYRGGVAEISDLVDGCGFLPLYPSGRNGLAKSIGDALGQNHSGLGLHRDKGAIARCEENVSLLLAIIPESDWPDLAVEIGCADLAAFGAWVESLPAVAPTVGMSADEDLPAASTGGTLPSAGASADEAADM